MASGGGLRLGELNIGWLSGILGIAAALTIGGIVPIVYALIAGLTSRNLRDYRARA